MRTKRDLLSERLRRQHVYPSCTLTSPAEVVAWFGGVQSQDYGGAKWAVGQRLDGAADADLDRALAEGSILRTHVLRPTWHFVARDDLQWMLALTAPRVLAASGTNRRKLGLTDAVLAKANDVLRQAVEGGAQLTREELGDALAEAGIDPTGQRLPHLLAAAELEGVLCSGGLRSKQHTYALFDARAPKARPMKREAAITELARRYFASHGPARPRTSRGGPGSPSPTPNPASSASTPSSNPPSSTGRPSGSRRSTGSTTSRPAPCCYLTTTNTSSPTWTAAPS